MEAGTEFDLGVELSCLVGRVVRHDAYLMWGMDPVTGMGCLLATDHQFTSRAPRDPQPEVPLDQERRLLDRLYRGPCPATVPPEGARLHELGARFAAEGFGDPMFVALRRGTLARGMLVLLRGNDLPAFSAGEAAAAGRLAGTLTDRMERFVAALPLRPADPLSLSGVLLVGSDNQISGMTPAGRAALRRLTPDGRRFTDEELCQALEYLILAARRDGVGLTRIPTRHGWIAVHAEPVDGSRTVAMRIDPASGAVLLPAVASWFGITPREQVVVGHALTGAPAKRIARALDVSLYTVNDHLKAVYRKTGLAGREELAAGLSR